jgi:hypothetical protein
MHLVLRKGRYGYIEESVREGKRVRKRILKYLGVMDFDWGATVRSDKGGLDWEAIGRQQIAIMEREDKERQAKLDELHATYGLTLGPAVPMPVEKPTPSSPVPAEAAPPPESAPPASAEPVTAPKPEQPSEQSPDAAPESEPTS